MELWEGLEGWKGKSCWRQLIYGSQDLQTDQVTLKSVGIQHTFFSSFKETCVWQCSATTQISGPIALGFNFLPLLFLSFQIQDVMRGANLRHFLHQLNGVTTDTGFILTSSTSTEQFCKVSMHIIPILQIGKPRPGKIDLISYVWQWVSSKAEIQT